MKLLSSLPVMALAALLSAPATGSAQSILLSAGNFALLGGTAITSTGVSGTTITSGNVGVYPNPTTSITGFPPAVITGGGAIIGTGGVTDQAQLDLTKAINGLAAMPSTDGLSNVDMGGLTLGPGVYTFTGAATQNGILKLDAQGQNDCHWVFQIATTLTTSVNSIVEIINPGSNGGSDDGVFWNVGTGATIGANNQILGNYLAGTSITFGGTTSGNGRDLAKAAITLDDNAVNSQGGPDGSDYTGGLAYNSTGAVVPTVPIFSTQPSDQTVAAGTNATFTAVASNSPTYQWQVENIGNLTFANLTDNTTYTGSNTTTLNVSNTTLAMTGDQYRVIARNGGGNTTSTTALLTVTTPLPIFSTQPANQAVATGANATFTVLANGNATYQWQREAFGNLTYANLTNTGAYSNVTTATLTVTNSTLVMSGDQFRAVATNVGGSTTSTSALLTVATPLPIFTTEPTSQTVPPGTNVTFTATAGGNATYQWQREAFGNLTYANLTNTGAYSNVTGTTLSVTNVTLAMSGDQFQLVATNLGGSATSTSALLTVQGSVTPLPVFTTQPVNQSITTGSNTSFTVAAGNSTYQWQELVAGNLTYANVTDSATFGGSNTTTLTITNATLALTGDQFRAVATNLGGNTTSTSALLTVTTNLPVFTTQPVNAIEVAGANATFTATAGANATYQWQLQPFGNLTYANLTNTGAYSNVTGTTLTVSNTTLVMSGDQFQLVATNGNGSTTSTSASLTVTTPLPIFTTQPADEAVIAGANTTFTAVTSGNATYQWQREAFGNLTYANLTNTGAYSNVTGTTLSVTNTTLPMDGDQFRAVATNLGGSTTSTSALLTVIIPIPMFTGQPANKTVVKGANTTFGVVATNGIDFQWQVLAPGSAGYANVTDNGTYSGATTKTLTVSNTTLAQSGTRFRAVAANDSGAVTSNAAVLTVNSSLVPVILTQPLSVNALTTSPVKFAIAVGGPRPITFVWEKNNVKLKNSGHIYQATTATLLIRNVVRGDAGNYRVIVTNKNGSVTSQVARLTIFIPTLEIVLSPVSATVKTGASVNFRVIANGLGMLDYLWKKNGVEIRNGGNVSGATTDILRLKNIDAADTGGYRAVVNNGQSTATSNSAMLTVNAAAD